MSSIFVDESNLHHIELVDTQTNLNKHKNTSEILLESGLAERRSSQSDASTASIGSSSHRSSAQTQEPRVLNETPKVRADVFLNFSLLSCDVIIGEDSHRGGEAVGRAFGRKMGTSPFPMSDYARCRPT